MWLQLSSNKLLWWQIEFWHNITQDIRNAPTIFFLKSRFAEFCKVNLWEVSNYNIQCQYWGLVITMRIYIYSIYIYCSVPQICPPSRISPPPCIFSANSRLGIFIPRISPPPPEEDSSRNRFLYLTSKPLGCLPLKCLLRTRTARINNGHTSYFAEASCFLDPQRWSSLANL